MYYITRSRAPSRLPRGTPLPPFEGMRRLAPALLCVALLAGCDADGDPDATGAPTRVATAGRSLADAPPELRRIRAQADRLLGGGARAFRARLRELRGHPVVVNKWASWCPPCRSEFPFLRAQALARGDEIGFLGVDSSDSRADAERFLSDNPVGFPSYEDPKLEVAADIGGVQAFPTTAFYDRRGELAYLHQGAYASEEKLAQDIERYAR